MENNEVSKIIKIIKPTYDHNYYKKMSSLSILKNSDEVLETYLSQEISSRGELILNIYGLLQNLFVYIDALYDLAKAVLNNKYSININQNKELRTIKHIRNDIVGHPTYRTYSRGGVSYSLINFELSTKVEIYYTVYYYFKNSNKVIDEKININDLISNYKFESETILKEIYHRLTVSPTFTNLYLDAYQLLVSLNEANVLQLLTNLKEKYLTAYQLKPDSQNRFTWRFMLLEKAIKLTKVELNEIKDYLCYYQANKLYFMFLELENVYYEKVSYQIPKLIKDLVKEIKDKNLIKYVYNLNDKSHFYYKNDVKELLLETKNPLFKYLLNEEDSDLVYLVGSVIRNLSLSK